MVVVESGELILSEDDREIVGRDGEERSWAARNAFEAVTCCWVAFGEEEKNWASLKAALREADEEDRWRASAAGERGVEEEVVELDRGRGDIPQVVANQEVDLD